MHRRVLCIASAGGHLKQLEAIISGRHDVIIVTNKPENVTLPVPCLRMADGTRSPWTHAANLARAIHACWRHQPRALLSTGGPACLSFILLFRLLGRRVVFVDTMSRIEDLSNTGRLVYRLRLASLFLVQWPGLRARYPRALCQGGPIYDLRDRR